MSDVQLIEVIVPAPIAAIDVVTGLQGLPGAGGGGGVIIAREVAVNVAAGQALRPNTLGKMTLARADAVNNCKGCVLAGTTALASFTTELASDFLVLNDWTAVIGTTNLTPAADYFLSPDIAGHLTTTAPVTPGQVVVLLGTALDSVTMALVTPDPIQL